MKVYTLQDVDLHFKPFFWKIHTRAWFSFFMRLWANMDYFLYTPFFSGFETRFAPASLSARRAVRRWVYRASICRVLWPEIIRISIISRSVSSNSLDIASWRRSWNLKSLILAFLVAFLIAQLIESGIILKTNSLSVFNFCNSARILRATGDRGIVLASPFFVFGKNTLRFLRLTLSHVRVDISVLLIAVARAKRITGRNSGLAFSRSLFSSSLSNRRVRPPVIFGLYTRLTGLIRLSIPQSMVATSKTRDKIFRSRRIVLAPTPSFSRSLMKSAISLLRIVARGL